MTALFVSGLPKGESTTGLRTALHRAFPEATKICLVIQSTSPAAGPPDSGRAYIQFASEEAASAALARISGPTADGAADSSSSASTANLVGWSEGPPLRHLRVRLVESVPTNVGVDGVMTVRELQRTTRFPLVDMLSPCGSGVEGRKRPREAGTAEESTESFMRDMQWRGFTALSADEALLFVQTLTRGGDRTRLTPVKDTTRTVALLRHPTYTAFLDER